MCISTNIVELVNMCYWIEFVRDFMQLGIAITENQSHLLMTQVKYNVRTINYVSHFLCVIFKSIGAMPYVRPYSYNIVDY